MTNVNVIQSYIIYSILILLLIQISLFYLFDYQIININNNINQLRGYNVNVFNSDVQRCSSNNRVGIIVPYIGSTLPASFNTFLLYTQLSNDLFDWIFVVTDDNIINNYVLPCNIKVIALSSKNFYQRLSTIDSAIDINKVRILQHLIEAKPYLLVEFKPALGYIFNDYLSSYSHWAYADIDILMGKVDSVLDINLLNTFDIITFSYGDSYRFYMRGQLTIHKNNNHLNNIWRKCKYLSNLSYQLIIYESSNFTKYIFESAEGCYSMAVNLTNNISIYVSSTQISDAYHDEISNKESLLIGSNLIKCYNRPVDINELLLPVQIPSYYLSNELAPIDYKDYQCAYWINPVYQVCLDYISPSVNIVKINQSIYFIKDSSNKSTNGSCRRGLLTHYQGWKKNYYIYTTKLPPLDSNMLLVTYSGFIPYRLSTPVPVPAISERVDVKSIYRYLMISDLIEMKSNNIKKLINVKRFQRKSIRLMYCVNYSFDMKSCISYLSLSHLTIASISNDYIKYKTKSHQYHNQITLITIGWLNDFNTNNYPNIITSWSGPKIIILCYYNDYSIRDRGDWLINNDYTVVLFNLIDYVDIFMDLNIMKLPEKLLYNIGLDIALTDLVFILPNYVDIYPFLNNDFQSSVQNDYKVLSSADELNSHLNVLVIPMYSYDIININKIISFPSNKYLFPGIQQPEYLQPDYNKMYEKSFNKSHVKSIQSNPTDYMKEKAIMLPFIYNTTACHHGSKFIRFPEELSCIGCYDNLIYYILIGSGYKLHWSNGYYGMTIDSIDHSFGCLKSKYLRSFVDAIDKYYIRATELRLSELTNLYSQENFEENYRQEQKLIFEKSK